MKIILPLSGSCCVLLLQVLLACVAKAEKKPVGIEAEGPQVAAESGAIQRSGGTPREITRSRAPALPAEIELPGEAMFHVTGDGPSQGHRFPDVGTLWGRAVELPLDGRKFGVVAREAGPGLLLMGMSGVLLFLRRLRRPPPVFVA